MSDMLKSFVRKELDEAIKEEHPHLRHPPCMRARVSGAKVQDGTYVCVLNILDKNGLKDEQYPQIPEVRTDIPVTAGDVVAVLMLYGGLDPYIVGRCP